MPNHRENKWIRVILNNKLLEILAIEGIECMLQEALKGWLKVQRMFADPAALFHFKRSPSSTYH